MTTNGQLTLHEEPQIPVVASDAASIMSVIAKAASDPQTDVDKMGRLLEMYERVKAQEAQQRFHEAMTAAQTDMRPIAANADNPQTKSKYATYHALDKALRPIYTKQGFALSFDTGDAPDAHVKVLCHVSHRDGHAKTYSVLMPADGKGAKGGDVMTRTHAAGAAMTYGQRYLLKLIFNVAIGADDDGNGAATPIAKVSKEQVKTLLDLIARTKGDIEKFCKAFGIEAVPDLPASRFNEAIERINLRGVRSMGPQ